LEIVMTDLEGSEGRPWPLGCSRNDADRSYSFALYSKDASSVTLLLYDDLDFTTAFRVLPLAFPGNKTGRVWHMRVPSSVAEGAKYYAFQVYGPFDPSRGQRFD
jgi:glycogen operon protein